MIGTLWRSATIRPRTPYSCARGDFVFCRGLYLRVQKTVARSCLESCRLLWALFWSLRADFARLGISPEIL